MVKPEWGAKRACQKCKIHFYDLKRDPIICPKCNTEFQPELLKKRRRGRLTSDDEILKGMNDKAEFAHKEGLTAVDPSEDLEALGFEQEEDLLEDADGLVNEDEDIIDDVIDRPLDEDME